jgi:anhydro-N-acetylmuramic acid kinase
VLKIALFLRIAFCNSGAARDRKCNFYNQKLLIFMGNLPAETYNVIGLMSGTSLDGLDIAFCRFVLNEGQWSFEIIKASTISYDEAMKQKLRSLEIATGEDFQLAHNEFGAYLGLRVSDFIIRHGLRPDFISSHGHTVFHQPENRLTVQIGAGNAIAAKCGLPVVCDFRSLDVALGGQGAPLVPVGDRLLFPQYDYCLNLGGFANISFENKGNRMAYDICPVNIVMNEIAERLGKHYDEDGAFAGEGLLSNYLLNELNQLPFYKQAGEGPKSLGKDWVLKNVDPLFDKYEIDDRDLLHTFCEHIAVQVGRAVNDKRKGKMLVTGGGSYNSYLIGRIRENCRQEIIVPEKEVIEFKEALIFAFLGVLRMRNEINCLKSVTGANRDNCGGAVYYG